MLLAGIIQIWRKNHWKMYEQYGYKNLEFRDMNKQKSVISGLKIALVDIISKFIFEVWEFWAM